MNESLRNILKQSKRIAFLGGAGISTESGIPDFRSSDGIYKAKKTYGVPPEILLSHDFFENYPELFYDYYKKNLIYPNAEPNRAHLALAKLEREGKLSAVITQNIDNLHQECGGIIKPDVVLYGEGLDERVLTESVRVIRNADTLIVGGTSLAVYPAAGLIDYFCGKELVLINLSETPRDREATLCIHERIGEALAFVLEDGDSD